MKKTLPPHLFSRYLFINKKMINKKVINKKASNKRRVNKKTNNKQRGAAGIEAVLLLPIVIILLFAIIHYSMIFFAASLFEHAAKEGIRTSMSYVDESCYFESDGCDDSEALTTFLPPIQNNTAAVIQNFTGGSGENLGSLFGVPLGNKDDLISVVLMSSGDCCKVVISLNYQENSFLPKGIIDGLLPGEGSVFPESITATASMKLN